MKKIWLLIMLLFTGVDFIKAQEVQALTIGDLVPDVGMGKTVPISNHASRTSEYNDKLLIIDLWATSCSSCIEAMPKFDYLQKHFADKITILPVTFEPEQLVSEFWKKNRYTKNLTLTTVVNDQIFHALFPHKIISHDVWIYKGKVIAITLPDYVTEENIQKVLDGRSVDLPFKDDFSKGFNGQLKSRNDSSKITANVFDLLKYAIIGKYDNKIKPGAIVNDNRAGISRDSSARSVRAYIINQPIYMSYLWSLYNAKGMDAMQLIFTVASGFEPTRYVWEVADQSKYIYRKGELSWDEWLKKNGICYESLNPDTGQTDQEVYRQIARDMDDLLGLHVRLENRRVKVLIMRRTIQTDLFKTKNSGIDASYHSYQEGSFFKVRDGVLTDLISELNQHYGNPYVIDATHYDGRIDLDLNIQNWTDLSNIKKELAKYGLTLVEEMRSVEVLVFTETGGGYKQKSK